MSHLVAFSRRAERFGDGVVLRSPALHLAERLSAAVGPKFAKLAMRNPPLVRREPVGSTPSTHRKQKTRQLDDINTRRRHPIPSERQVVRPDEVRPVRSESSTVLEAPRVPRHKMMARRARPAHEGLRKSERRRDG